MADVLWQRATEGQDFRAAEARAALHQRLRAETKLITDKDLQKYLQDDLTTRLQEAFPAPQQQQYTPQEAGRYNKNSKQQNYTAPGPRPQKAVSRIDNGLICLASLLHHPGLLHEHHEELTTITLPQAADQDWLEQLLSLPHDPPPDQHPVFDELKAVLAARLTSAFYRLAPHAKADADYKEMVRPAFAHWLSKQNKDL